MSDQSAAQPQRSPLPALEQDQSLALLFDVSRELTSILERDELLQHIAVSGQLENPAAEEIVRLPRYCPDDREQAERSRGARLADNDTDSADGRAGPEQRQPALSS